MCTENSGSIYEKGHSIEKAKEELRNGSRSNEPEETWQIGATCDLGLDPFVIKDISGQLAKPEWGLWVKGIWEFCGDLTTFRKYEIISK